MPSEAARKKMAVEYAQRLNEGDVEGALALFADDVVFEDPVGKPPLIGKAALRRHFELAVKCKVHEIPGEPIASMDDRHVVTPTRVVLHAPTKMSFHIIGIVEVGEDGLGHHVRAFWGMTDMHLPGARP